MRIAILSDVHGNLAALEAVLRHAQAQAQGTIDAFWCLGDTVGYGPQPRECVALLRERGALLVAGNHDRAGTGKMGTEEFNPDAATAARWTIDRLGAEERAYLESLPEVFLQGEFTLVHGTLRRPIWEYLYSPEAAQAHLERQQTPFGLVGHTHIPMLILERPQSPNGCEISFLEDGTKVKLTRERKMVINPGSVGQPRDGDPRAAYAILDREADTVALHRVEYHIEATQRLMEAARLPRWLIERLALGR